MWRPPWLRVFQHNQQGPANTHRGPHTEDYCTGSCATHTHTLPGMHLDDAVQHAQKPQSMLSGPKMGRAATPQDVATLHENAGSVCVLIDSKPAPTPSHGGGWSQHCPRARLLRMRVMQRTMPPAPTPRSNNGTRLTTANLQQLYTDKPRNDGHETREKAAASKDGSTHRNHPRSTRGSGWLDLHQNNQHVCCPVPAVLPCACCTPRVPALAPQLQAGGGAAASASAAAASAAAAACSADAAAASTESAVGVGRAAIMQGACAHAQKLTHTQRGTQHTACNSGASALNRPCSSGCPPPCKALALCVGGEGAKGSQPAGPLGE